jgi:hypothetical protein
MLSRAQDAQYMEAAQPDAQPCMQAACELLSAPLANLRESSVQRFGFLLNFCHTKMSYPSFADGRSTDIALEQLERPLINTATGRKAHASAYTILPTDERTTTANWFYRITLDTWVPEIFALLISAASIIAIAAILDH